jgi:glycosyltransferase involved in cell wall biosynthesis
MMAEEKPAVALIVPGGLGTGRNNIGVPVMEGIVRRLALKYAVTVFQLFPVNEGYQPPDFVIVPVLGPTFVARCFRFSVAFRNAHRKRKFVAVHGFWVLPCGLLALLAARLVSIRSVVSVLGGDGVGLEAIDYGRLNSARNRWLTFLVLRHVDEAVVLTKYLAESLYQAGLKGKQLKIVPWGVDRQLFNFQPNTINGPIRFLHVANFHPVKNQEMMLRAFREIRNLIDGRLQIIGEGIDAAKVSRWIDELRLNDDVEIVPPVSYKELPKYYHAADILLHTSLSEGQSEVVTEAMSCGVLVCGTKVGLMYDLPGSCRSVAPGDWRALASTVVALIYDPATAEQIRMSAQKWTMEFDIEWTVERYSEFYVGD